MGIKSKKQPVLTVAQQEAAEKNREILNILQQNELLLNQSGGYKHNNHKKPVTRRDFLAIGATTGLASIYTPNIFQLLSSKVAQAQQCVPQAGGGANLVGIPYAEMVYGGGAAALALDVAAGGAGGQKDESWTGGQQSSWRNRGVAIGLGPVTYEERFGLVFNSRSPFMRGFKRGLTGQQNFNDNDPIINSVAALMNGYVSCSRSGNDTANNPGSVLEKIAFLRGIGNKVHTARQNGYGTSNAAGSAVPSVVRFNPGDLTSANALLSLPGLTNGNLNFSVNAATKVLEAMSRTAKTQIDTLTGGTLIEQVRALASQSFCDTTTALVNPSSAIIPTLDPQTPGVFNTPGITIARLQNNARVTFAADFNESETIRHAVCAQLLLEGHASATGIEIGGHDYHNQGTQNMGDKNHAAGVHAGKWFRLAFLKGKPLMMRFVSDGSVDCGNTETTIDGANMTEPTGDSEDGGYDFVLVLGTAASGRPKHIRNRQYGQMRPDGVDPNVQSVTANTNGLNSSWLAVLNWMALSNYPNLASAFAAAHGGNSQIGPDLIAFEPLDLT